MYAQRTKDSPEVDLTDWDFGFGDLDSALRKNVTDAIRNALADEDYGGVYVQLPVPSDGADPLTLDIMLPFAAGADFVGYEVSLTKLFMEELPDMDAEKAIAARDALLQIAATLHRVNFPAADFPDYHSVTVPTIFRYPPDPEAVFNLTTYQGWKSDELLRYLEEHIENAKESIENVRAHKVMLEAALEVAKQKHAQAATTEARPLSTVSESTSAPIASRR